LIVVLCVRAETDVKMRLKLVLEVFLDVSLWKHALYEISVSRMYFNVF